MIALLKMHFYLSRKVLAGIFLGIALIIGLCFYFLDNFNIGFTTIYLLMLPVLSIGFLFENQFIQLIRTMPIQPTLFVKSLFVFCFLLITFLTAPLIMYHYYLYDLKQISPFEFMLSFNAFAIGLAYIGAIVKKCLQDPVTNINSISFGTFFFYFFLLFILHLLISLIFSIFGFELLGGLVIPIISLFIFYNHYKKSVAHYMSAEF